MNDIKKLLGFRPPYLLVDRITQCEGNEFVGIKNVAVNEPYFDGHFPNDPVMPGVAQLEAMFQMGVICHRKRGPNIFLVPFLHELRKVKFRKPVMPGDRLEIMAQIISLSDHRLVVKMACRVAQNLTSEAELVIQFYEDLQGISISKKVPFPQLNPDEDNKGFNVTDIQKIIPHRSPFVFIDRILYNQTTADGKNTVIGVKNVTFNEPHSLSCLNEFVFLPSPFQLEMIAQTGCVYTLSQPQHHGKSIYFTSIDQARFYRPATPGDQLYVRATTLIVKEKYGKGEGATFINDELVSEAKIKFAILER